MNKKLYKLMNWPEIEGIIYADEAHPERILGPQIKGTQTLIQAFFPGTRKVSVLTGTPAKSYVMERVDEDGFYAALIPGKIKTEYQYQIEYTKPESGEKQTAVFADPYAFSAPVPEEEKRKWNAGTHYHAYQWMGAHVTKIEGTQGVLFRVWAPEAVRVSVVGEFNHFDGRVHPMSLDEETGIFSLFIPGLSETCEYQYEILRKGGLAVCKADPYAPMMVDRESHYHMCLVSDRTHPYVWRYPNVSGLHARKDSKKQVLVYEMNLHDFLQNIESKETYEEALRKKIDWVSQLGYTHVALTGVLLENTAQTAIHEPLSFYALNDRFTQPEDLMKMVDLMHEAGLYVIMDYAAACFCSAKELLSQYDGSFLYEHMDERQGYHSGFQVALFHYGRPQVTNFLISGAVRLVEEFHADGIRFCDTSFILYLDYGKQGGEWIPNLYGGNENLEGIEFLKHSSSILKKLYPKLMLITDEFSGWRNMTTPLSEDGFGFDCKWNYAFTNELMKYLSVDPINRKIYHHELTMSYLYLYLEQYMLAVSGDYLAKGECGLDCIYGQENPELVNAQKRLLYAYTIVHPGYKYFMHLFEESEAAFCADCNHLYLDHPALYEADDRESGFEWINSISAEECVLVFLRKAKEETLLVAVNFANCAWENHKTGVPFDGKYKEIFSSQDSKYHGVGSGNTRVLKSKKDECDMRENSIRINLPPLSVSVFEYIPYSEAELEQMRKKEAERQKKLEEARKKKERLKKEKAKIKASLKEELARKIAKAEEEIAKGSEYKKGKR